MSGLAAVLAGRREPAVHRWESALDVADVRHAVEHAGWGFGHIDAVDALAMTEREQVLLAIGRALDFPEHFRGRSLDGLHDCLRDLPGPTVLLWEGWGPFAREQERAFGRICAVLRRRDPGNPPLEVLLRGPGPEEPAPLLD